MSLTSKYKLAEQALRIILGGHPTPDSGVKIQELMIHVSQAFSNIVRQTFFQGKAEGEPYINGSFIYTFEDQEVKEDKKLKKFFIDMPATTVTLPYDIGIFQISNMRDQPGSFTPVSPGFEAMTAGLLVGELEDSVGYYPEGNRIYFVNMKDTEKSDTVLVKLVAPLGSLGDEDEITVNDDIQQQIVEMTVAIYQREEGVPHDEQNDNVKQP